MQFCMTRKERYLHKRLDYEIARDFYCNQNDLDLSATVPFSAMDDPMAYNDPSDAPTSQYLIDIWKDYIDKNAEHMLQAFAHVPPFPVLSADHTFNISKRTKDRVLPLDPEYTATGSSSAAKFETSEDANTTLIIMGANGQIEYHGDTKGSTGLKDALLTVKAKCDRLQVK